MHATAKSVLHFCEGSAQAWVTSQNKQLMQFLQHDMQKTKKDGNRGPPEL